MCQISVERPSLRVYWLTWVVIQLIHLHKPPNHSSAYLIPPIQLIRLSQLYMPIYITNQMATYMDLPYIEKCDLIVGVAMGPVNGLMSRPPIGRG